MSSFNSIESTSKLLQLRKPSAILYINPIDSIYRRVGREDREGICRIHSFVNTDRCKIRCRSSLEYGRP